MADPLKGILESKTFSITWRIERFFADCEEMGDYYESPLLQHGKQGAWQMTVNPKGNYEQCKDFVSLYLNFLHAEFEETATPIVTFQCSILDEANSIFMKQQKTSFGDCIEEGWDDFIKQSVLKDPKNKVLINDTLTILCEVTFHPLDYDITKSICDYSEWLDKIGNGFDEYEELLKSGSFADVTFNVGDKQIKAHKAILSCRSPVFKAMFEHEMKEKTQNSVEITDIDYDVMNEFIRFVYSRKVDDIKKLACELLYAANKYQVIELKALCEKTIHDELTVDNAIEYLKLADLCDTIHLKTLIVKFVAAHPKDIVKKPGFEDLNRTLMHQIIQALVEKD